MTNVRRAAAIAPPVIRRLDAEGRLTLELPPEGVALIQIA
jgi:xylan 1,4-beta-xylosidase